MGDLAMMINRETILKAILSDLGSEDYILAIWLEGSDGTNTLDEYSDIDLADELFRNAVAEADVMLSRDSNT